MWYIDFDRTLFDYASFQDYLFATYPEHRVLHSLSRPERQHYVQKVVEEGFSFRADELAPFIYADAREFLAQSVTIQKSILTFGHVEWQKKKIIACGMAGQFADVLFSGYALKGDYLKQHGAAGKGNVFIDDDPAQLESMREAFPDMALVQIDRENAVPLAEAADYRVESMLELLRLPLPR